MLRDFDKRCVAQTKSERKQQFAGEYSAALAAWRKRSRREMRKQIKNGGLVFAVETLPQMFEPVYQLVVEHSEENVEPTLKLMQPSVDNEVAPQSEHIVMPSSPNTSPMQSPARKVVAFAPPRGVARPEGVVDVRFPSHFRSITAPKRCDSRILACNLEFRSRAVSTNN